MAQRASPSPGTPTSVPNHSAERSSGCSRCFRSNSLLWPQGGMEDSLSAWPPWESWVKVLCWLQPGHLGSEPADSRPLSHYSFISNKQRSQTLVAYGPMFSLHASVSPAIKWDPTKGTWASFTPQVSQMGGARLQGTPILGSLGRFQQMSSEYESHTGKPGESCQHGWSRLAAYTCCVGQPAPASPPRDCEAHAGPWPRYHGCPPWGHGPKPGSNMGGASGSGRSEKGMDARVE